MNIYLPFPPPGKTEPATGNVRVVYGPNGRRRRTMLLRRVAQPPQPVVIVPSPYSIAWGATDNRATEASNRGPEPFADQFQAYLPTAVQAVSALTEGDARTQVNLLEAKIRNYETMKRTPPYNVVPGTLWYDNEIAKMRARLIAARQKLALTREGESATRDWRNLGQTALGVGIVAGVALVMLTLAGTARVARR